MKRNTIFIVILFSLFVYGVLPNYSKTSKVYYHKTAVGKFQKIGTLSPIQPLEDSSLATEALILLPGLNSVKLSEDLYEWKNFWNTWQKSNLIDQKKYKLFVFRYDGWNSLYESAETLTIGLRELLKENPQIKTISFLGYSQGGLLPRIILIKNTDLEKMTRKIITFASAHQGAIVLTSKLVKDTVKTQSGLVRAKNLQFLKILATRYRNAYLEQAWTNFDNGFSSKYYIPPQESINFPNPQDKSKYINYGSYFSPLYAKDWEDNLNIFFSEIIPRLFLDRRAGMKELNRWMKKKIYPDEKPALREHLKLNDGVTPLVSALWGHLCTKDEKQPETWHKLFPTNSFCPSTPFQRVFSGIDHLEWREDKSGLYKKHDQFHPEQEPKTIYDWIISDLEK